MDILQATFHWLLQPQHWTGDAGILLRLREHLYYVLISIVVASAIALPLGIILGYWRKGAFVIINLFNIGRAIPSLGLILLCIIVFGFNDIPVFTALVAMSIPPILTNASGWHLSCRPSAVRCGKSAGHDATPEPVAAADTARRAADTRRPADRAGTADRDRRRRRLRRAWRPRALSDRRTWPARYSQVIAGSLVVSLLAIGCELLFHYSPGASFRRRSRK